MSSTAEFARLGQAFVAARSREDACKFIDDYPQVRDPALVASLVNSAQMALKYGDDQQADALLWHGQLLCGSAERSAPEMICELLTLAVASAEGTPTDVAAARQLIDAVRTDRVRAVISSCHPDIAALTFSNLADAMTNLADFTDQPLRLMADAVELAELAVQVSPVNSLERATWLDELARRYGGLYGFSGDSESLLLAVSATQEALATAPESSALRSSLMFNAAVRLGDLYAATSNLVHLNAAIDLAQQAVEATPKNSERLPSRLSKLADVYGDLHEATRDLSHLDTAIEFAQRAVDSTPESSAELPIVLNSLALRRNNQYEATGDPSALRTAVRLHEQAVALITEDSGSRGALLGNLGLRYGDLYELTTDFSQLKRAVEVSEQAVEATPEDASRYPGLLNNLGIRYSDLYRATGNRSHLNTAVDLGERAVNATPEGSTDRPRHLNSLANHLQSLYYATSDLTQLQAAVKYARECVRATPDEALERASHLNNLALRYSALYWESWDRSHLDAAVDHGTHAVEATPLSSTERPRHLGNLATHYCAMHRVTGRQEWLQMGLDLLVPGSSPLDGVTIGRTKARLMVGLERYEEAATSLTDALDLLNVERQRIVDNPQQLRDLAGATEGMVADLAQIYASLKKPAEAIRVIEQARIWLTTPPVDPVRDLDVSVVWVVPTSTGTILIARDQEKRLGMTEVALSRGDLQGLVSNAVLGMSSQSTAKSRQDLIQAAIDITRNFPSVDRLLVVPVGIAALIPWYACEGPSGAILLETTTISVAPTLAWGSSPPSPVPEMTAVGFFHSGSPHAHNWLDLTQDRATYAAHTKGKILNHPNRAETLASLEDRPGLAHFSCHASYDREDPLRSSLELGEPVQLRDLFMLASCPPVVNLSACETGIPDLSRSEQALSFPTSFLRAGATNVIGTLWPVGNEIATEFNGRFYSELSRGHRPASACRTAIRQLVRSATEGELRSQIASEGRPDPTRESGLADPANWAAFIHYGHPA